MPDPDSANACNPVSPTKPTAATEADTSEAGQVEETSANPREIKSGKYGSQKVKTHSKNEENKDKTHWIEVELVDDAGQPVAGEPLEIECPDGSVASATTDDKGQVRVENLDPGSCKIKFTQLDKDAWEPA